VGFLRRLARRKYRNRRARERRRTPDHHGPFTEGKEHLGGFTIIKAADLDGALDWGRKLATVLTPLAIEVRPFHDDATH